MHPVDDNRSVAEKNIDAALVNASVKAPNWSRRLRAIDLTIRLCAVVVIGTLGMAVLLLASIMATDTGTIKAMTAALALFVGGCGVFALIAFMAIFPAWFAKRLPGPSVIWNVLVRIPVYVVGTLGLGLLLRQIWYVAIPDMLRKLPW